MSFTFHLQGIQEPDDGFPEYRVAKPGNCLERANPATSDALLFKPHVIR
jgi:hypothetical protein